MYCQRVERIIRFCEFLTLPDGTQAGRTVKLRPWQKEFINAVYSPQDENGKRIVREALLTMGRKNGKTALIAMLMLVHLCGPEAVRGGQLYSVAFDREQAGIVFNYASKMVYDSEFLCDRLLVTESRKMIRDPQSHSVYQALSAESRSKHGRSSSFIVFDELAQFGTDRKLYDTMMTSRGAHEEPLVMVISTQADRDDALLSEIVDRGKKINSGEIVDPSTVAFIYEVPMEMDIYDENNWKLANPALGDFSNIEIMRRDAKIAKDSPSGESAFRNLYMNQRISAEPPFVTPDVWKRNGAKPKDEVFEKGIVYGGLDLSEKNDLTALVFVCCDEKGKWHVKPFFYKPKEGLEAQASRDRVPYDVWVKQGLITAVPGPVINYDYVATQIGEALEQWNIDSIRFDRWHMPILKQELDRAGIPAWIDGTDEPITGGVKLIPHGQGYKDFSPAIDRLEDLLLEGKLCHGNNPVLTMCAANAKIVKDPAGNRKFDKSKSTNRIDGIVALAMATNWTQDQEQVEFFAELW